MFLQSKTASQNDFNESYTSKISLLINVKIATSNDNLILTKEVAPGLFDLDK